MVTFIIIAIVIVALIVFASSKTDVAPANISPDTFKSMVVAAKKSVDAEGWIFLLEAFNARHYVKSDDLGLYSSGIKKYRIKTEKDVFTTPEGDKFYNVTVLGLITIDYDSREAALELISTTDSNGPFDYKQPKKAGFKPIPKGSITETIFNSTYSKS